MRRVLAVLSVVLGTVTMGMVATTVAPTVGGATTPTSVAYDSTDHTATSLVSQCYECAQVSELGNQVQLSGASHTLNNVVVQMESWGCESGDAYGQSGPCISPDKYFQWPITLNLYNVGPDGTSVGSLIATVTQTQSILYRPTADPVHCPAAVGSTDSEWWDGSSCHYGIVSPVTFNFADITVPTKFVYGVAVNTGNYGASPQSCPSMQPVGCPANSLNLGLTTTDVQPSAGSDPVQGAIYQNTLYQPYYCDNGTTGTFRPDLPLDYGTDPSSPAQSCWSANGPYTSINGGSNATGPAPYYVPAVQFNVESTCTTTCYVNAATGNDANSGQADSPFATIQHGVSTVSSGGTVIVAPGTYSGNVQISQPETLLGANANTPATGARGPESVISTGNATGNDITVDVSSPNVTVDGFTVQQTAALSCSSCAAFGVQVDPGSSGARVADNIITGMSTSGSNPGTQAGNPIGVNVAANGSTVSSNVTVARNLIENISSAGTQHRSALGIEIGDSSAGLPSGGISILANHITNVTSGSWGAYGVIVNRAATTTGSQVIGNTFDAIDGGGWTHAIGLEGPSPAAVITNNAFSGISAGSADSADIFTDATNSSGATTDTVSHNSFGGLTSGGIGSVSTGSLTASNNWWGCPGGPNTTGCSATGGTGPLVLTPWIVAYTADPAHAGQPGFWPIAVTASSAPAFTSASTVALHTGAVESFTVAASGTPAPVLSEAVTDTLPPGMSFNPATGVLSGTPTVLGTSSLHFTAHNGAYADATQTLTVNVIGISSASSLQTSVGKHFTFKVTTSGQPAATVWDVGMPGWMTLTPGTGAKAGTAVLTGTAPALGGNYSFTFYASFGSGQFSIQTFTVHVLGFTSVAGTNFSKSGPPTQSFTVTTTGAGTTASISANLGPRQAGLTFHDNGNGTATISGQPGPTAKTQLVKVTATSGSAKISEKLAIGISN